MFCILAVCGLHCFLHTLCIPYEWISGCLVKLGALMVFFLRNGFIRQDSLYISTDLCQNYEIFHDPRKSLKNIYPLLSNLEFGIFILFIKIHVKLSDMTSQNCHFNKLYVFHMCLCLLCYVRFMTA